MTASKELDLLLPELPVEKAAIASVKDSLLAPPSLLQKAGLCTRPDLFPSHCPGSIPTSMLG